MKNICHDLLIYTPTAFLSQPFSGGNLSPKRQSLKRAHSSLSLQHLADLHEGRNAKGFKMKKKVAKDFCGRPMSDNQRSNIQMMGYLLCLNNNSWLYPHPSFFFSFFHFVIVLIYLCEILHQRKGSHFLYLYTEKEWKFFMRHI